MKAIAFSSEVEPVRVKKTRHKKLAHAVTGLKVSGRAASHEIPLHTDGMRIGLLGGSFNPPHAAHRAISRFAIKRLQLDRVWWLVTPGNPLKELGGLTRTGRTRRRCAQNG